MLGTVAEFNELVNETIDPPFGAGALIVTVPVDDVPPPTEVGFSDTAVNPIGLTVNVAFAEDVALDPVIFGSDCDATLIVVMAKVAEVAPDVTVTELGTVAAA